MAAAFTWRLVYRPVFRIKSSVDTLFLQKYQFARHLSVNAKMKGLVLGVHTKPSGCYNEIVNFTDAAKDVNQALSGKLLDLLKEAGSFYKPKKYRLLYGIPELNQLGKYNCVSMVDLGPEDVKQDDLEGRDLKLENVRRAIADGIQALTCSGQFEDIYVDPCGYPQCVAEAAKLTTFSYDELKQKSSQKQKVNLHLFKSNSVSPDSVKWFDRGIAVAECQNFARTLMEAPANLMTPQIFVSTVTKQLEHTSIKVVARDESWIKEQKMGSFMSVAKGSDEKPMFLELHYEGAPDSKKSIALVGKGITFDSGGISLKPSKDMDKMRADMGGAACVCSIIYAASLLKLKINLKGFAALCENMPSGKANKPGDVVYAMNGKSIQVDNTDAEGRLILADALCYAQKFSPAAVLDLATLTGAIIVSLGNNATGVFSNDNHLWKQLQKAGYQTGDRMWRMPLYSSYSKLVTDCHLADINNLGKAPGCAGSCIAAAFLKEFISPDTKWLHLDIASVMENNKDDLPYAACGMSGRPTRTVVQFLEAIADELK